MTNVPSAFASQVSIDGTGNLTVGSITSDIAITLNAVYTDAPDVYSGSLPINITAVGALYGVGPFGINTQALAQSYITNALNTEGIFAVDTQAGIYGYFMSPVSYGSATFENTANNVQGGWDGASWPQDQVGTQLGPIVIDIITNGVTLQYNLYRTDYDGTGSQTYQVTY